MTDKTQIRDHMPVIAADGQQVGTVDHLDGNSIKLAKNDPHSQGQHHWIPLGWIETIDEHVHLNKSSNDVMQQWSNSKPNDM